jgi:hypothetical protein
MTYELDRIEDDLKKDDPRLDRGRLQWELRQTKRIRPASPL